MCLALLNIFIGCCVVGISEPKALVVLVSLFPGAGSFVERNQYSLQYVGHGSDVLCSLYSEQFRSFARFFSFFVH